MCTALASSGTDDVPAVHWDDDCSTTAATAVVFGTLARPLAFFRDIFYGFPGAKL